MYETYTHLDKVNKKISDIFEDFKQLEYLFNKPVFLFEKQIENNASQIFSEFLEIIKLETLADLPLALTGGTDFKLEFIEIVAIDLATSKMKYSLEEFQSISFFKLLSISFWFIFPTLESNLIYRYKRCLSLLTAYGYLVSLKASETSAFSDTKQDFKLSRP